MVTEISPIFGLTLLEPDLWSAIAIVMAGLTVSFMIIQNRQHAKTTSADLSLRMIDTIRRKDFRDILGKIRDGKSNELKGNEIGKVLNHYEYLAEFEKGKLLNFDHVLHQHGRNIKMLYDDHVVKQQFDNARGNNQKYNYINLANLFIKVNHSID